MDWNEKWGIWSFMKKDGTQERCQQSGVEFSQVMILILLVGLGLLFENSAAIDTSLSALKQCPRCAELFDSVSPLAPTSWEPKTCKLRDYNSMDFKKCLKNANHTIAIVGDSRLRQFFNAVRNLLENSNISTLANFQKHDLNYSSENIELNFFWHPFMNESTFQLVSSWLEGDAGDRPDLVVIGIGTWYRREEAIAAGAAKADQVFVHYQKTMKRFSQLLNKLDKWTPVIWVAQGPHERSHYAQQPRTMSEYNAIAETILKETHVKYWKSAFEIADLLFKESPDFSHYSVNVTDALRSFVVNLYCNTKLELNKEHCCMTFDDCPQEFPATILWSWRISIAIMIIILSTAITTRIFSPRLSSALSLMLSLILFTAIIVLCRILERLSTVSCNAIQFSQMKFYFFSIAILMLTYLSKTTSLENSFLHKDQINEWKGWMQFILILYHVTGSSQNLGIFMIFRFLVSSYLVLIGYEEYMFFIKNGGLSCSRILQVIFRMNFLCVLLCITSNQPYQFYYLIPLLTFWYIVVCFTLLLPPRPLSEHPKACLFNLCKISAIVAAVKILHAYEHLFEYVFSVGIWRHLFIDNNGTLQTWRFQWSTDRFSALFGVFLGILATSNVKSVFNPRLASTVAAIMGLFVPTSLGLLYEDKPQCSEMHAFLFFIPVMSLIYLRNISESVRQRYSWLMAAFGQINLELFVLLHDLWLCDDAQGTIQVLPWPLLNDALLILLLIASSFVTHGTTVKLLLSTRVSPELCYTS